MTTLFAVRVGLTALSTRADADTPEARALAQAILHAAADDGYAARDALTHPAISPVMGSPEQNRLARTLTASGLGAGGITDDMLGPLLGAVDLAERRLPELIDHHRNSG